MKKIFVVNGLMVLLCLNFLCIKAQTDSDKQPPVKTEKESSLPKYEVQLNYTSESLSRNYGSWRTAGIYVEYKTSVLRTLWASYRVVERNSRRDQEFTAGIYKSLKKRRAFTLEATYSPTNNMVGKFSVLGEIEKAFKNGWVGHLGARYTSFKTAKVTSGFATVEKYWGNNRAAYTLYLTKVTRAGIAPTHRFQYNRYYGERLNTFGFSVSTGKDYEYLGPTEGVFRSRTWSIGGSVKHWLTKKFAVNADATLHRQGNLYYRRGINFGIRYRF